ISSFETQLSYLVRQCRVSTRQRWVPERKLWVSGREHWVSERRRWVSERERSIEKRARWVSGRECSLHEGQASLVGDGLTRSGSRGSMSYCIYTSLMCGLCPERATVHSRWQRHRGATPNVPTLKGSYLHRVSCDPFRVEPLKFLLPGTMSPAIEGRPF